MNKDLQAVFSNRTDDWATPEIIFDYLERYCEVKKDEWFDPCPLGAFDKGYDGLKVDWSNHENIYINPPYSNIKGFVEKAIETHTNDRTKAIYFLIPARTDTKYYKLLFEYGCNFEFIEGRLKFGKSKHSSTFPSVLVQLNGDGVMRNQIYYISKNKLHGGNK
ncbi:DNA N-6-adenine-methyltransferase [Haploplasma axanthum]|uniref:Phage N-6-adenine-methyltransferase n=1 Tax=Haploplasma axanthum TaxID=29552 RepID=A0A449BG02_HAPAX|nr:DNA N-6-adenine-methyltransferase [Haploplasma axanthum]VEU79532.1 phage N-6-adenine-methyltransferase [Haploplasma axanthum]VEU81333.1 phage N-6-adenine-methyltransferase [Haploplasma axanthum]VEU81352.1 phage N-6-adenine-methyltransferase [Haploplasma axanthum]VEU81369.1 phage N-6-adenine-methyltransferase [Haploplasma axanthum]